MNGRVPWKALTFVATVSAALGAWAGAAVLPYGLGWATLQGSIVFVVLVLGQLVGLRAFGRWVREKAAAERLAARNASIRAGHGSTVLL